MLAALPWKNECRCTSEDVAGEDVGMGRIGRQCTEPGMQFLTGGGDDRRGVVQCGAAGRERVGDVGEALAASRGQVCAEPACLICQCGWGYRREKDCSRCGFGDRTSQRFVLCGAFFDDEVGVGARDAESGDAGPAGPTVAVPRCGFRAP